MLQVDRISKTYAGGRRRKKAAGSESPAVDDVSFHVDEGEFVTLLGPSGCGKTTSLRAIAGLETPDKGRITLGKRTLYSGDSGTNLPANERGLSMVFQSYAIWPHMTVYGNVSFPLEVSRRSRRLSRAQVRERVEKALAVTELSAMMDRPATNLSGGQQQRLSLARALATEPQLMLLDEPLSNLDATLRSSMRIELKRLQLDLGITSVYVTHDQAEALALSTRIIVMNQGKIEQVGTPSEIYTKPGSRFVAEFMGNSNMLVGTVKGSRGGTVVVTTELGEVIADSITAAEAAGRVIVSIRAEDLKVVPDTADTARAAENEWVGQVVAKAYMGECIDYVVRVGAAEVRCRCDPSTAHDVGGQVRLTVPVANVRALSMSA